MVTHDESTFYSNDGKEKSWFMEQEVQLQPKGPGGSIMVSEFQCACHGTMRYNGQVSRTLFYAGTNRDGYWTYEHLVNQLEEQAIPIFRSLHPDCKGLFIFDQSSNHTAYSADALVASRMTLNDKRYRLYKSEKPKYHFKDTTFIDNNKDGKHQTFFYYGSKRMANGLPKYMWFKGVKKILEERGLWHDSDRTEHRKRKAWRLHCNDKNGNGNPPECCAYHCLANQPDFRNQKSALKETLDNHGMILEFYPKFHCECIWIERYWADVKRDVRANCDYTSGLKEGLPLALDRASPANQVPTRIRRYYRRCWRYIEAYSKGMDADGAYNQVVKKFVNRVEKSHRRLNADE
jgi:hypothetical protein